MAELLQSGDVARRLGISPERVRQLENAGKLPAKRTASGHRIFRTEDVERLAAEREMREAASAAAAN